MAIFRYSKNMSLANGKFEIKTVWEKTKYSIQGLILLGSYSESLQFHFIKGNKRIENVSDGFGFTFHPKNLDFFFSFKNKLKSSMETYINPKIESLFLDKWNIWGFH